MPVRSRVLSRPLRGWVWALPFVGLSVWILGRFIEPVAWAAIVAIVTWPLYRLFARRLGSTTSSGVAALTFTVVVSLFAIAPMVFAFGALSAEAARFVAWIQSVDPAGVSLPRWAESLPLVGGAVAASWHAFVGAQGGAAWYPHMDAPAVMGWARTLGRFLERHLFIGFFTVFALFFVYRGGEALAGTLRRLAGERLDSRVPRYMSLATTAVRATVGGMVALALFDGIATGLLYAAAGVPRPAVWGAVTGILAMVPFVGYVAVAGVGLALAAQGAEWSAFAVVAAGSSVVFVGDKVVRPLAIGRAVKLNLFWVLVGSLGGFEALGLLGVFVGPVVFVLCGEMWREWTRNPARGPSRSDATPTLS